jgi:acyl carrier protein phosphodiesterase
MNFLAHALLAGDDDEVILGSLLGDFIHGRIAPGLPPKVEQGVRLHRAIDVHTDAHPVVVALRAQIPAPFRRYAGILLDIWFDHLLARDFPRWSSTRLQDYSQQVRALLRRHDAELPDDMRRFAAYMERSDLPAAYADAAVTGRAITGVGQRLRRENPLHQALPVLQQLDPILERGLREFFPQLLRFAQDWRAAQQP